MWTNVVTNPSLIVTYLGMVALADNFTQSLPCSLVVYQYYQTAGMDSTFMALYQAMLSKEDEEVVILPDSFIRRLHVPVSRTKTLRNKQALCNSAIIEINQVLELMIRDLIRAAFLDELDSCRRNDVKLRIKPVFDGILERFGLSEEAKSFDAVKKDVQRFCRAKNIEYKSLKKVRKPVPKLGSNRRNRRSDGILLSDYLKYKGIHKATFYRREYKTLDTFIFKHRRYIRTDSLPKDHLSFVTPTKG